MMARQHGKKKKKKVLELEEQEEEEGEEMVVQQLRSQDSRRWMGKRRQMVKRAC